MHPNPTKRGCDWCGGALPKRCRRWCSRACEGEWWHNHVWTYARAEALRRAEVRDGAGGFVGWRCAHCAGVFVTPESRTGHALIVRSGGAVEVNHIVPCKGAHGQAGCHHHLAGLEVLCPPCHRDVTARQRAGGWVEVAPAEPVCAQVALFN